MKTFQKRIAQILKITSNIEANYPELYAILDETPLTIPTSENPNMTVDLMDEYLDSLKQILKKYKESL
tara:strand:+ start:6565 stop:6768 length:204 start_codon:yes stop_codon:yes gene_type:complete